MVPSALQAGVSEMVELIQVRTLVTLPNTLGYAALYVLHDTLGGLRNEATPTK